MEKPIVECCIYKGIWLTLLAFFATKESTESTSNMHKLQESRSPKSIIQKIPSCSSFKGFNCGMPRHYKSFWRELGPDSPAMHAIEDVSASTLPCVSLAAPLNIQKKSLTQDEEAYNVLPFGITQKKALSMDPSLTATSFGYVPGVFTLSPTDEGPLIPGLTYLRNFISKDEEHALLAEIDDGPWDGDNKSRRTKQFGYGFHWRNRHSNALVRLAPPQDHMPRSSHAILERLKLHGCIDSVNFDQCIVNDYIGGQGIKAHRDREFFGEVVLGMSLLESVVMDFKCLKTGEVRALLLEPRSVLLLQGEVRWLWQHSITPAPTLLYRGALLPRGRRTSLTFRTIADDSVIAGSEA